MRHRRGSAAVLISSLSLCAVTGCTFEPPREKAAPSTGDRSCAVTEVRKDPLPEKLDQGFSDPSSPPPWMGGGDFAAVLFYADGDDPTITPGGKAADGGNTKILWLIRAADGPLTVRGTEAVGRGSFTQEVTRSDGISYPSIVVVPSAGCWTLEASVSGRVAGSITVPAA
ncbi:hypothetical protein GCM10009677_43170 [Sphaerisporangium rubeum]|uniref:Lipoprotein n=1 Tax=Sphaerisporangium rubeum TaxID=321317 RepID=A0A7X0IA66_9ACTN|nr:hypothetical protein [Sphaerisporangium rubeum]MBB6471457.1 hypothetical protein [Sphaerisporangium rubeum]